MRKFIIFSLILTILGLVLLYFSTTIEIKDEIEINIFDEYKNEVKAYSLFQDVTDKLEISGNVDTSKIGDYKVTYYYNFLCFTKNKEVIVHVVDKEAPVITLKGEEKIEVFLNDKYVEPGYEAKDNYDQNVKVTVENDLDTSKIGDYYLIYKAEDSSGNKTEVVRKVVVSRVSPLALSLKDFDLNDYFPDTIMKSTEPMDKSYLDKIVLAGDSVIWKFGTFKIFPSDRVWAKPCEGPGNFNTQKVVYKNAQTDYTLADLVKEKQPEYLYLHMGICNCDQDNVLAFANYYEKVIDYIREVSPKTKLVIMSLVPQVKEYMSWIPKRNNVIINKYNYYLADVCAKKGVPFLNVAEVLKNSSGLGNPNYYFDDGYHPNTAGMKKILEYINTHGYVE